MENIKFAWKQSIPVLLGYLFLGMAFGLMLQDAGYHFVWAFMISVLVYSGSMQFVLVTLLSGGASLVYTAMMTLFVNGRHVFYGFSLIQRYRKMGKAYPYMIMSLTDETYSLMCRTKVPEHLDENKTLFWISLFNHCYWISGSVLGCMIGQIFGFDSTGVDFSMTALFVAIVIEQWQEGKSRIPTLIGFGSSLICLWILGADLFILPSLSASVCVLLLWRKH